MSRTEEIQAREQAATLGEWEYDESEGIFVTYGISPHNGIVHCNPFITVGVDTPEETGNEEPFYYVKVSDADAEFIAHSRSDTPYLPDEIKHKDEEIEQLKTELARYQEAEKEGLWIKKEQRLTERDEFGEARHRRYYDRDGHFQYPSIKDITERVCQYEETGLGPLAAKILMTVVEQLKAKNTIYEKAKEEGRLVILPCKVFDKVYQIVLNRIVEREIKSIEVYSNANYRLIFGTTIYAFTDDIDKTVFFTQEAAQAALKGELNGTL